MFMWISFDMNCVFYIIDQKIVQNTFVIIIIFSLNIFDMININGSNIFINFYPRNSDAKINFYDK